MSLVLAMDLYPAIQVAEVVVWELIAEVNQLHLTSIHGRIGRGGVHVGGRVSGDVREDLL